MRSESQVKSKITFICQQCGKESPKWLGRCPSCGAWGSFVETRISPPSRSSHHPQLASNAPQELYTAQKGDIHRFNLGFSELNRVLGGGLVPGSLVLIGGEPGIGKSTLLLQTSDSVARNNKLVVYVSGEESITQVKLRAERLKISGKNIYFLAETNLEQVLQHLDEISPALVMVDSIQTVYLDDVAGVPGSISQVRECTLRLMYWAKQKNIPVFIAGHVTKEGSIAGPGTLEHIVDVVLYFEGEPFHNYRMLRGAKNRFGSTNEVGVFEMGSDGLIEVNNPSQAFLSQHEDTSIGSVVIPTLEGSRPLLVEAQALTSSTSFGPPRRIANGIDFNRLLLISAVLSKRARIKLSNQDIIINVTGGLRINEPAADLGIALAIASSAHDIPPLAKLAVMGEIGLSGELRTIPQIERRITEAARLGFNACLLPKSNSNPPLQHADIHLLTADSITEALRLGLSKKG